MGRGPPVNYTARLIAKHVSKKGGASHYQG